MTEVSRLYSSIIDKKDAVFSEQERLDAERSDVIRNKVNLQHRITGLWFAASIIGGYYVWSNWTPLQEGESLFSALANRSWTPLEIGVAAGYGVLTMAMQSSRAIVDLCHGSPPQEGQSEDLSRMEGELAGEMTEYLTRGLQNTDKIPVDRVQHLIALDLEPAHVVALLHTAFGAIGTKQAVE